MWWKWKPEPGSTETRQNYPGAEYRVKQANGKWTAWLPANGLMQAQQLADDLAKKERRKK